MLKKLQFYISIGTLSYFCLIPSSEAFKYAPQDKVSHTIGYLMLFLSVSIGYNYRKWRLLKFAGLLLYSFLIEVAQYYIPNRTFSGFDMAANALGLIIGWGIVVIYAKRSVRR
ncbi:MAG: VanZ family protein [Candidatus Anammoxibacter sp.]